MSRGTMPAAWNGLKREIRPSLKLAIPVVLAEIGWMTMGLVDTLMVGPLGPAAIGGVGLGNTLYIFFAVFGMGLLLGLDTLVSQATGAGNRPDTWKSLVAGGWLAVFIAAGVWIAVQLVAANLHRAGFAAGGSGPHGVLPSSHGVGRHPVLRVRSLPALICKGSARCGRS